MFSGILEFIGFMIDVIKISYYFLSLIGSCAANKKLAA